jgi:amino acid transporter
LFLNFLQLQFSNQLVNGANSMGLEKPSRRSASGNLGTFAGVFTPSILTILGIILFLRLGFVVGSAGLGRALIILSLANAISVLTTFSLSAIATNLKVRGGGDYYLISRTLGLEFGGAIGLVLYMAQSVSIAFYCIGFGEVVASLSGSQMAGLPQLVAAGAVAFLFVLAWLGADWATRFQYVVMGCLTAALLSFFIGGVMHWDITTLRQNWAAPAESPSFWVVFAIFFPAVTGFTQGVSMSGDLKDPGKSLPLGTFLAVGLSIVVYFSAAFILAATAPQQKLIADYNVMQQISVWGLLITIGVIAATLSSAMASYLGAPRILQSLAGDRIFAFLHPFAKGYGPTHNPRRGVLLSTVIAYATIAIGNLNLIAPIVSMFFLISYGLLNYATYYEARTESPSFRPRFHWFDKRASLMGAIACLAVMLAIDPMAGIISIAIIFAVFQYLKRTAGPARWADSRRSFHMQQIRRHLLSAAAEPNHPRYWRPQMLLFSENNQRRQRLLQFASWIQGASGFISVVRIIEGFGPQVAQARKKALDEIEQHINEAQIDAFPLAVAAADLGQSIQTIIQAFGIGPVRANTILLNWVEKTPLASSLYVGSVLGRNLSSVRRYGCNVVMVDAKTAQWDQMLAMPTDEKRIDIWWHGNDATCRLMLMLAYLLTRSVQWENAKIRLVTSQEGRHASETDTQLRQMLDEVRIEAEPYIVSVADRAMFVKESSDAALVFIPFSIQQFSLRGPFDNPLEEFIVSVPVVAMVMAAEDIILDADPEEGPAADMGLALDLLSKAEKRVQYAEKEFEHASAAIESIKGKLNQLFSDYEDFSNRKLMSTVIQEVTQAEERLTKAKRRLLREKSKAQTALEKAEALGVNVNDKKMPET